MTSSPLTARGVSLGYGDRLVADHLDLEVPESQVTVIVGPNACGKSTLLKALSRLLRPASGSVLLDGRDIHALPTKQVARRLGLLPQSPTAPSGIRVGDLVARGRHPHQQVLRQWSRADEAAVERAMTATNVLDLADRPVDELSGGQRQRVWMAMVLAQETALLLLDEPTTFLDIVHQLDVLELCRRINREQRTTVVMVLHDLNQAARYADLVVAMRAGRIEAVGTPDEVFEPETIHRVFGLEALVHPDPVTGTPMVIPLPPDPAGG